MADCAVELLVPWRQWFSEYSIHRKRKKVNEQRLVLRYANGKINRRMMMIISGDLDKALIGGARLNLHLYAVCDSSH